MKKFCLPWLSIGLTVIMAVGCGGTTAVQPGPRVEPAVVSSKGTGSLEQRLRAEVQHWEGTPHRMGGSSRNGIDCSGFAQRLYWDIFRQTIPRSTSLQVRAGQPVDKKQLRPGDLVFFNIVDKGPHVGIYLSRGEFAHASTSKGVMISNLNELYWQESYWTARRYPIGSN